MQNDLSFRLEKARGQPSVVAINEKALEEAEGKNDPFLCFGVKDTIRFPVGVFRRFLESGDYLWLTVDRMADRGRSIDTGLVNPLTYRPMTGSTSGGAINVLLGIDDFALGTDGGGSILAPALACQLPSCTLSGLGVFAEGGIVSSTDGLARKPGVGIIGKTLQIVEKAVTAVVGDELPPQKLCPRVAIPRKGDLRMPGDEDMAEKLESFAWDLKDAFCFEPVDMRGAEDRKRGIDICQKCFGNSYDLILTYEGPIDVLGYGETIPAMFDGIGPELAKRGGKYLLKAASPCGATAVTVPSGELASGFVILAPSGKDAAACAFMMAELLTRLVRLPDVFIRYFLNAERPIGGFQIPN
jgi:Asp-tRNA(Asn)/Glu-tRNA(Gln) amidotransferase A subunit family amidase